MAIEDEFSLVACMLVGDQDPVVACIPDVWFVDQESRALWSAIRSGAVGLDALVESKAACGFRSARAIAQAIDSTFLWNVRWYAWRVWRAAVGRKLTAAIPRVVTALASGVDIVPAPLLWPCWEAEAIDCCGPDQAAQVLVSERRLGRPWTNDPHLLWLLRARIQERTEPIQGVARV